jgi:hypothetical protein
MEHVEKVGSGQPTVSKQHYLPASYISRFSIDTDAPARERRYSDADFERNLGKDMAEGISSVPPPALCELLEQEEAATYSEVEQ